MQRLCGIMYHLKCIMFYFQINPTVRANHLLNIVKRVEYVKNPPKCCEQLLKVVNYRMLSCCIADKLNRYWISEIYMCNRDYTVGCVYTVYFQMYESFRKVLCSWDVEKIDSLPDLCCLWCHQWTWSYKHFLYESTISFLFSFFCCIYSLKQNRKLSRWYTPPM